MCMSRWAPWQHFSSPGWAPPVGKAPAIMAAGRLPPLEELGLPENSLFEVVLHGDSRSSSNPQRRLRGRLVDGQIQLVEGPPGWPWPDGFAVGQRVDPWGFLAAAGYSDQGSDYYSRIWLPGLGVTLKNRVDGDEANATAEGQPIARLLERKYGVKSLGELWQYVEVRCCVAPLVCSAPPWCRHAGAPVPQSPLALLKGLTSKLCAMLSWILQVHPIKPIKGKSVYRVCR